MKLYEINQAIADLIDPETGEVADFESVVALQMERSEKLENLALLIKDLKAEAEAIKAEEKALESRRKPLENQAARLTQYLDDMLMGDSIKTPKVAVSYRRTKKVVTTDEFLDWALTHNEDLLKFEAPKPKLTEIKRAIESGAEILYAKIEESRSMSIK